MKIDPKYKIRVVADESIIMVQSGENNEMTDVISLNSTSVWLFEQLQGVDFDLSDVVALLMSRFDVKEGEAREDAARWLDTFVEYGVVKK